MGERLQNVVDLSLVVKGTSQKLCQTILERLFLLSTQQVAFQRDRIEQKDEEAEEGSKCRKTKHSIDKTVEVPFWQGSVD